jgi:hypothetical protein
MQSDKTPFEKLYQKEVVNAQFELDSDFINDLEKRLDHEDKKRQRGLFWFFSGSFIFLISIGIFLLFYSNSETKKLHTNRLLNKSISKNTKLKVSNSKSNTINGDSSLSTMVAKSNSKIVTSDDMYAKTHKKVKDKFGFGSQFNSSQKLNKEIKQNQLIGHVLMENLQEKQEIIPSSTSDTFSENYNNKSDTITEDSASKSFKNDSSAILSKPPLSTPIEDKFKSQTRNSRFEVQLIGGVNLSRSILYSNSNWISSFDQSLIASERSLISPTYGLNFFLNAGKIQFGLGATKTKIGESTHYWYVDQEITQNPTNPSQFDTLYQFKQHSGINKYDFIQVPLSLGYHLEFNRFSIIPRYSYAVGIKSNENKGYYPSRNGYGITEVSSPRIVFQHSMTIDFRLNYKNYFFSVTPFLTNTRTNSYPLIFNNRRYLNCGVNLGVGFRFE